MMQTNYSIKCLTMVLKGKMSKTRYYDLQEINDIHINIYLVMLNTELDNIHESARAMLDNLAMQKFGS